jgi:uncharacterized protein YvpB
MVGRAWRWHVVAAAVGVIVAAASGAFFLRAGLAQEARASRSQGEVHQQPTATPSTACRIPVTTLSLQKGNSLAGGFLTLPDGTYQTDPASGVSYDGRFRRWLPVDADLIAPDSSSYVDSDSGGVFLVDLASGSRRLLLPATAGRWVPRRFTLQGVYVDAAGTSVAPLGAGLSLLTLDGRLTPITGSFRNWRVGGLDEAWGYYDSNNPDRSLYRLDLNDHSVTAWFHPPAGTTRLYVLGVDAGARPFIAFQSGPSGPWHMGVVGTRDTFSEAVQPPGMATAIGYGIGYTDSKGLWMGMDGLGLVLYAPDGTMKVVSTVPANILRAVGSCEIIQTAAIRPTSAPAVTAAPVVPTPPPTPAPARFAINVPMHRQQSTLSCEEAALAMVLAFYGHAMTEQQVFGQVGIDRVHYWAGRAGGGDPYLQFVGDPNGSEVQQTGYGVYWPPIKAAAEHFGATVAQAGEGIAPSTVYTAIGANHPVLVWVTYDLRPHVRSDYRAYDGRSVPYAGPYEHAMVVTGLNDADVRVNDPDAGQYWVPRSQFEAAYAVYNQMALIFG